MTRCADYAQSGCRSESRLSNSSGISATVSEPLAVREWFRPESPKYSHFYGLGVIRSSVMTRIALPFATDRYLSCDSMTDCASHLLQLAQFIVTEVHVGCPETALTARRAVSSDASAQNLKTSPGKSGSRKAFGSAASNATGTIRPRNVRERYTGLLLPMTPATVLPHSTAMSLPFATISNVSDAAAPSGIAAQCVPVFTAWAQPSPRTRPS